MDKEKYDKIKGIVDVSQMISGVSAMVVAIMGLVPIIIFSEVVPIVFPIVMIFGGGPLAAMFGISMGSRYTKSQVPKIFPEEDLQKEVIEIKKSISTAERLKKEVPDLEEKINVSLDMFKNLSDENRTLDNIIRNGELIDEYRGLVRYKHEVIRKLNKEKCNIDMMCKDLDSKIQQMKDITKKTFDCIDILSELNKVSNLYDKAYKELQEVTKEKITKNDLNISSNITNDPRYIKMKKYYKKHVGPVIDKLPPEYSLEDPTQVLSTSQLFQESPPEYSLEDPLLKPTAPSLDSYSDLRNEPNVEIDRIDLNKKEDKGKNIT